MFGNGELTWCKEDLADSRIDSGWHGGTHDHAVHDQVVMRELDALYSSSRSGGKADGAGYVLRASSLKIIGRKALCSCLTDDVVRELHNDEHVIRES